MGILLFLTLSIVTSVSCSKPTTNSTDCNKICEKCTASQAEKGRCLIVCPSLQNPRHLCKSSPKYSELVIGISIGVVLCLVLIMGGLLCVRFRKKKKDRLPKQNAKELKKFHKELDRLRPHAYTFLGMLNNVRRQVREMYRAGNTDAAVICGRSLSDLAKILMLINRRDIPIVPPDWPRLLGWAERLLERSMLASTQAQVNHQLIQFLQTPASRSREFFGTNQSTPMSTLKPPAYEDFIPLQDQTTFTQFPMSKSEWSQHWDVPEDMPENRVSTSREDDAWRSRQPVVQENLWIDDDFFMMTFRPQDEIVTVL